MRETYIKCIVGAIGGLILGVIVTENLGGILAWGAIGFAIVLFADFYSLNAIGQRKLQEESRIAFELRFKELGGVARGANYCCGGDVLNGFCEEPESIILVHRDGSHFVFKGVGILRVEVIPDISTRISSKGGGSFVSFGGVGFGSQNQTTHVESKLNAVWVEVLIDDLESPRIMLFFNTIAVAQIWADRLEVIQSRNSPR